MWLSQIQNIKTKQPTKQNLEKTMGIRWLQTTYSFLVTGNSQHCDSEHAETANRNYVFIVILLCTAIAALSLSSIVISVDC